MRRLLIVSTAASLAAIPLLAQNLTSLPEYQPAQKVSGTIRSWGDKSMTTLMEYWEEGFRKYHPDIRFSNTLKGNASAQYGLHHWVADLALMGREIWPIEIFGVRQRALQLPVEVTVATGSYDVPHKTFAITIFVHKDNPISRLTVKQLDGIFGAERSGGWRWLEWSPDAARSAKENVRTWGQLGLTGAWAQKRIHPYGPPGVYPGGVTFFQAKVFGGGDKFNEDLREFESGEQMMEALGKDPYGIAYTCMRYKTSLVKPVALAANEGGAYVEPTKENVGNGTYPLARSIYVYFAPTHP